MKAASASHEPARPEFPLVYAMHLNCPGGHGDWRHDDLLLFNTLEEPTTGDVVCVHFKNGREPVLLELTMGIMDGRWAMMPYTEHPDSTALATVVGTIVGTDHTHALKLEDLWAVHKCDGLYEAEAAA